MSKRRSARSERGLRERSESEVFDFCFLREV